MILKHWSYFLALEEDLLRLARFVEFNRSNFSTFSLEMAHLLLASTSEIDVLLKMLCKPFDPTAQNENSYRIIIPQNIQNFTKLKVEISRYDLVLQPWLPWDNNQTPYWWTAYNKVKHERDSHYEKASLGNVLASMAGLFVCKLYLYKDLANMDKLEPWAKIFYPEDQYIQSISPGEGGWALNFRL